MVRRVLITTLAVTLGLWVQAQRAGDAAPDFTLMDASGEVTTPAEFRGAPLLINFWATWCGPCKEELPLFQEVRDAAPELQVLLINLSEERERAQGYLDEHEVDLRTAVDPSERPEASLDETGQVARRYRVLGLPTTVFVDAEGMIREVRIGQVFPDDLAQSLAKIGIDWQP